MCHYYLNLFILLTSLLLTAFNTAAANEPNTFPHDLIFEDESCKQLGECILKQKFGYIDPNGVGWEARAGNKTDGASIPKWLQSKLIGRPFDDDILRAAVIHDHYCDRTVRSWWKTHKVFYDALLASGVNKKRAKLLFTGVLLGGPKWLFVRKDVDICNTGETCIQQNGKTIVEEIRSRLTQDFDEVVEAQFDEIAVIIERKVDISLENILDLAKKQNPSDQFFINGDRLILNLSTSFGNTE